MKRSLNRKRFQIDTVRPNTYKACSFWRGRQVVRPSSAKALFAGSIPARASTLKFCTYGVLARVVELVDTQDLKS